MLAKAAKDPILLHDFLFDLLSPAEYTDLAVRWQIIKQLHEGKPQREVAKDLRVSVATITRGSKEMMNKNGGFRRILDRYYNKKSRL